MKTSQWRRAVENRDASSVHACLKIKALSDRSGHSGDRIVLLADGSMWLVR